MKKAKRMHKKHNRLTASVAMATALAISASTPVLAEVADTAAQPNNGSGPVMPEVKDTPELPAVYTVEEAAAQNAKADEALRDVAEQNAEIAQENAAIDHETEETETQETTEEQAPENGDAEETEQDTAEAGATEEEAAKPNQTVAAENAAADEANRAQIEANAENAAAEQEAGPALPEVPEAPVFAGTLPEMPSAPQMQDTMSAAEKNAALDAYSQQLEAYNTLVEAYNQAVNQYNNAVDDGVRGEAAASYNAAVEAYNQAVETINSRTAASNRDAVTANSGAVQENQAVADANKAQDEANQTVVQANALLDADGAEIGTEFRVTEADGTTTTVTLQLPDAPDAGLLERLTDAQRAELEQNHAAAVAAYNEAVAQYKTDAAAYRAAVQRYNQAVKCYNEAVAASNQAAIEQAAAEKEEQDIEPMLSDEGSALAEQAQTVRDRKEALEALEATLAAQKAPTTDAEVAAYNALVKQYNEADEAYWRAIDAYNAAATEKNKEVDLANAVQQAANQTNAADNMQTIAQDLLTIAQVGNFAEGEAGTVETASTTDANGVTTVTTQITPTDGTAYRVAGTVRTWNGQTTLTGITVEVTAPDENGQPHTQTFTLNLTDAAWLEKAEAIRFDPNGYASYNEAVWAYLEQLAQYDANTDALVGGYNAAVEEYLQFTAQYDAAIGQYQAILNAADTSLQTVNASTLQELATKLSGNAVKDSFANAVGQTYTHADGANAATNITFNSADEARQYHNEVLTQEVNDAKAALEAAREAITNDGLTGANIAVYNQAVQAYNLAVTNYNNFAVLCDPEKLTSSSQTSSTSNAVDRPLYMAQNSSDAYFYILFSGTVPFETSGKSYGAQYYTESKTVNNADGTVGYTSHSTMKGTVQSSTIYPSRLTFGTGDDADAKVIVENQYYPAQLYRDAEGNEVVYYVDAAGKLYTDRALTEATQIDTAQIEVVRALYVDKVGAQYTLDAQGRLCDAVGNLVQVTENGTTVQYKVVEGKGNTLYVTDTTGKYATGVSINVTVPESKDIVVNNEWNTRAFDFATEEELKTYFENVNTAITELPTREKVAEVLTSSGFDDAIVQAYKNNQIDTLWYVVKTEKTVHVDGVLYWKDSLQVVGREQLSKLTKLTALNTSEQNNTSIGLTPLAALDVNGQTVVVLFAGADDTQDTVLKDTLGLLDDSLTADVVALEDLLEMLAPLQSGLREVTPAQLPEKALYVESTLLEETSPNLTPDERQIMQEIIAIISANLPAETAPEVDLQDEATPLAELPEGLDESQLVEIEEPLIPRSEAPRTGDGAGLWAISALMAMGGLLRKKKYHSERNKAENS
jgi:hypothetical protein